MFLTVLQTIFRQLRKHPLFYIVLIICAANWQLLFGIKSMQWDVTNFWAPWRYYISECYTNGHIPLWDPYAQAGYPVHGDLQGPAYCPEAIISSFIFPISLYFFNLLYIGYLVLGAYGLFKLSTSILEKVKLKNGSVPDETTFKKAGILSAVIYALSGYNVGHGHYLYITISVALLPWIYYYFIKLFYKGTYIDAIKLALFIFWQVTAGNPSFLIITGYFLAFLTVMRFVYLFRNKRKEEIFYFLKRVLPAFILVVLLSLPVFINAFFVFPDTSRFGGMKMDFAGEENFVFKNFFTFFTSLISYERDLKLGNDQPIFNHYIGLFTLLFSIIGFIKFRSFWLRAFSVIAVIAMLLSFGLETPVYGIFYKYFPFVNVFRMPRLVFIHVLVFALLLFSCGMVYYLKEGIKIKTVLVYSIIALLISLASVLFFKFAYHELKTGYEVRFDTLRDLLWTSTQAQKAFVSLLINAALITAAYSFFKQGKVKRVILLLLFDVALNYNLGSICRNFSEDKLSFSDSYIRKLPQGFPVPANIPAKKIDLVTNHFNEFWKNIPIYLKQPYYGNDNSFELSRYMELFEYRRDEYNYWLTLPQAFFADSIAYTFNPSFAQQHKKIAVLDSLARINPGTVNFSSSANTLRCTLFEPEKIIYSLNCAGTSAFATQQNYTSLWKVKINGKPATVYYCFNSFPLVIVPPGKSVVEFSYEVPYFHGASLLSCILFVVLAIIVILRTGNKKIRYTTLLVFTAVVVYSAGKFVVGKSRNIQAGYPHAIEQLALTAKENGAGELVVNGQDEIDPFLKPGMKAVNLLFREDLAELCEILKKTKSDKLAYLRYGGSHSVEAETLVRYYYGSAVSCKKLDFGDITIYERNPQSRLLKYENKLDMEAVECGDCKIKDSLTGAIRLRVDKAHEFSPGFSFTLAEAKAESYDMLVAECELETNFPDFIGLCISIENNGVIKKFPTYNYVHYPDKKVQKICLPYRLLASYKKEDLVKVYVWNNSGQPVFLKSLTVKVLKVE